MGGGLEGFGRCRAIGVHMIYLDRQNIGFSSLRFFCIFLGACFLGEVEN